jgi:outer membrane immunogenic protein
VPGAEAGVMCSGGIMQRFLIRCAAVVVLGSSAFASDYDPAVRSDVFTAPPAFSSVRVYNWTGAYIGINAGGAFGRDAWVSTPDGSGGVVNFSGAFAGGTLGYNLQTGSPSVWGVEIDVARASIKASVPTVLLPIVITHPNTGVVTVTPPAPVSCVPNCEIEAHWLSTARLRYGYAFDNILPYVTAGVSMGRLFAHIAGTPLGTQTKNNLSWTVGGGVEVAIVGPWRAKLEYLYVDLDGFSCDISCGGSTVSNNLRANVIRAGINYRLWDR